MFDCGLDARYYKILAHKKATPPRVALFALLEVLRLSIATTYNVFLLGEYLQ